MRKLLGRGVQLFLILIVVMVPWGDVYFQTEQRVHFKSEQLRVPQLYLNEVETEGSLSLALNFYLFLSFKFSVESKSVGSRGNLWSCLPLRLDLRGSQREGKARNDAHGLAFDEQTASLAHERWVQV